MNPDLGYSLFVALGVLAAYVIRRFEAARLGYDRHRNYAIVIVGCLLGAVVGMKLGMWMYIDAEAMATLTNNVASLRFEGKTVLGGLAGGYVGGEITKKLVGVDFSTGDALALALPVGQAFGRLGCFIGGCCFGTVTDSAIGVYSHGVARHPVQLYEAAGCAVIAIVIFRLRTRFRVDGHLFETFLLSYFFLRFALEFVRGDAVFFALGLTVAQWFCAVAASLVAVRMIARARHYLPKQAEL